ncbi:MAG: CCA tRNA nucleotidyltransferase [Amphiplicatus sp.]
MTASPDDLRAVSAGEAKHFFWTQDAPVAKIVAALEAERSDAVRFVGGCVRDSLLGVKPKDVDLATLLKPEDVVAALKNARLRAAPTGIEHGTVTGIAGGVGVEITTLRADVSTDGRRATVAFTEDWAEDARRRDFTLNAIYLTTDGSLFDPVGGIEDLKAGRVRFIGEARDRIREDYLRILRFFRFSARFAGAFDAAGLAACGAERSGVKKLSAERVGDEISKILVLPRAPIAIEEMQRAGILAEVWPAEPSLERFAFLKSLSPSAPAPVGLAALWGEAGEGLDSALRLSKADAARRRAALKAAAVIKSGMAAKDARVALYRAGQTAFRDGALLSAACAGGDGQALARLVGIADDNAPPVFPFTGKDVITLGVPAGPRVAATLKAAEEVWISEDFPDAGRAKEILQTEVSKKSVY